MEKVQCTCGCLIGVSRMESHLAGNQHIKMLMNKKKEEFMEDPSYAIFKLDILLDLEDAKLINVAIERIESIAQMLKTKLEFI
jgi:hypothetical protein